MTTIASIFCEGCKHLIQYSMPLSCKAFPNGIPMEILKKAKHDKPLPDQGNDIIFEPKP